MAEKERELLRQKEKEQKQVMEAQERSFRENITKLQEKMERERETLLREQEKMLEHKLKVSVDDGAYQCQTDAAVTPQEGNCSSQTCNFNCECFIEVHMGLTEAVSIRAQHLCRVRLSSVQMMSPGF